MNSKSLSIKNNFENQGATVLGPADFPIGSPESRAAARLRLQEIGVTGEVASACICFPADEPPFFCSPPEQQIAAAVKCSLHGNRFAKFMPHLYVSQWRREKEAARRKRLSDQYRKAWAVRVPAA